MSPPKKIARSRVILVQHSLVVILEASRGNIELFHILESENTSALQGTNISHLRKRKIIDSKVPWKVIC